MTDTNDTGGGNGDLHPAFNSPAPRQPSFVWHYRTPG